MANVKLMCGDKTALIQTRGAQIISFQDQSRKEMIWQGEPGIWEDHAPVLFPVCGTPTGKHVEIDGVSYPMGQHGFTVDAEFETAGRSEHHVDLILTANEATRRHYPFEFSLRVGYTLTPLGFCVDYSVENHSNRVMPFCIGGHPGFVLPMEDGADFSDYHLIFPEKESGRNLLVTGDALVNGEEVLPLLNGTTLPLCHDLFDKRDTLLFAGYRSRSVDLVHRTTGRGLRFSYPRMEVLAVWTMPEEHRDFICLEPWHGLPGLVNESGKFEEKPYVTMLQPGGTYKCGYQVELITCAEDSSLTRMT